MLLPFDMIGLLNQVQGILLYYLEMQFNSFVVIVCLYKVCSV